MNYGINQTVKDAASKIHVTNSCLIDKKMSKYKDYLALRFLIFGLPKKISKVQMTLSVTYIVILFVYSLYKVFIEHADYWVYDALLVITIITTVFILLYYYFNRTDYRKKHYKNTQSYLSISANIFRLLFTGSNVLAIIGYSSTYDFYDIIIISLSAIYLLIISLSTIYNIFMILLRMIEFRKYIPLLKNRKIVNTVATDIRKSIDTDY